jgi:hypothetical protein
MTSVASRLTSLALGAALVGCSSNHDLLAQRPGPDSDGAVSDSPAGQDGFPVGRRDSATAPDAGDPEPPGPWLLTLMNGVVDVDAAALLFRSNRGCRRAGTRRSTSAGAGPFVRRSRSSFDTRPDRSRDDRRTPLPRRRGHWRQGRPLLPTDSAGTGHGGRFPGPATRRGGRTPTRPRSRWHSPRREAISRSPADAQSLTEPDAGAVDGDGGDAAEATARGRGDLRYGLRVHHAGPFARAALAPKTSRLGFQAVNR